MELEVVVTGSAKVNSYIVSNEDSDCLVVDPGADPGELLANIRKRGLQVHGYLLTHGHLDHVAGLAVLFETHPAPSWLHPNDKEILAKGGFGIVGDPSQQDLVTKVVFRPFEPHGEVMDFPFLVRALHLPGHSPGSVVYFLPEHGLAFSGDTIFAGFCANTTPYGANAVDLANSLRELMKLPGQTKLLPGHGRSTTVDVERQTNYDVKKMTGLKPSV